MLRASRHDERVPPPDWVARAHAALTIPLQVALQARPVDPDDPARLVP